MDIEWDIVDYGMKVWRKIDFTNQISTTGFVKRPSGYTKYNANLAVPMLHKEISLGLLWVFLKL